VQRLAGVGKEGKNKMVKLGVPYLDEEHENIMRDVNKVLDILTSNIDHDGKRNMSLKIITAASKHVSTHFNDEEAYMRSISHYEAEKHSEEHIRIKNIFVEFLKKIHKLTIDEYDKTVLNFTLEFKEIITNHIDTYDARIQKL